MFSITAYSTMNNFIATSLLNKKVLWIRLGLYLLTFLSLTAVHKSMQDCLLCKSLMLATVEFPADANLFCILHLTYSASGIVFKLHANNCKCLHCIRYIYHIIMLK